LKPATSRGAKIELYHNEEVAKVVARPVDGVAIHNTGDHEFTHFAVEEIRTGRWRDSAVDWRRGIRICGPDALVEELRAMLAAQGVTPTTFRPLIAPVEDVKIRARILHYAVDAARHREDRYELSHVSPRNRIRASSRLRSDSQIRPIPTRVTDIGSHMETPLCGYLCGLVSGAGFQQNLTDWARDFPLILRFRIAARH
jgi:hypothetical protein